MTSHQENGLNLPDYTVSPQVWQQIENRLDRSRSVSPYWAIAAAVVLSVLLVLPTQTLKSPPYWLELLHHSQLQSQQQLSPLLFQGEDARKEYLPLKQLDDAITRVMEALGRDPNNPKLARMLKQLYQQQWQLMTTISALPKTN